MTFTSVFFIIIIIIQMSCKNDFRLNPVIQRSLRNDYHLNPAEQKLQKHLSFELVTQSS